MRIIEALHRTLRNAENDALERAAKVAEDFQAKGAGGWHSPGICNQIAEKIRALKNAKENSHA